VVYLDTNVFSFIAKSGEAREVKQVLERSDALVAASDSQLSEIYSIRDEGKRAAELRVITSLTKRHLPPASYSHAMELLGEIRRLRPEWLRRHPDTSRIEPILNGLKRTWVQARLHPDQLPPGFDPYHQDSERGIAKQTESQKKVRGVRTRGSRSNPEGRLRFEYETALSGRITVEEGDVVGYWRVHALMVWYHALVNRIPESRDYVDWIGPYLRQLTFKREDWEHFWLREVEPGRMPKDFLTALANYYQIHQRVTHGNPADSLHANHLLDCELFLTADQRFHTVLRQVRMHFPDPGDIGFIQQKNRSASDEIQSALANYVGTGG
jgi:hypothetical protein